jgi:hypothetical protein
MLNLVLYDGLSLWVGDIHIPKVQGFRLNQMFGPIDESRLMVIVWVIGLKLQVTREQFLLQCAAMN